MIALPLSATLAARAADAQSTDGRVGAAVVAVAGLVIVGVALFAATGRLPRNGFAGIRIPSTMRSDAAWRAGHRAGAPWLIVAGSAALLLGLIGLLWRAAALPLTLAAAGVIVVLLVPATVVAGRAARRTHP